MRPEQACQGQLGLTLTRRYCRFESRTLVADPVLVLLSVHGLLTPMWTRSHLRSLLSRLACHGGIGLSGH